MQLERFASGLTYYKVGIELCTAVEQIKLRTTYEEGGAHENGMRLRVVA